MKKTLLLCLYTGLGISAALSQADTPVLSAWIRNTSGITGYNNLPANVQLVRYSDSSVYVSCSSIPGYSIGPWPSDPNFPSNQNFVFRIPRHPMANAGTPVQTPLGPIAVWTNGVVTFNARDARSYLNQDVWHQNAVFVEASSFDSCLGHPAPGGVYHHHQNPRCLYEATPGQPSPILGYAFDGFPIYGPYGMLQGGGIGRIRSSYRLRAIDMRSSLPDGTVLPRSQYGPAVSDSIPLGYYVEDYEYVSGLGDLDQYNGQFVVNSDYPDGTYAYFVTINPDGSSAYPYAIGPQYYGIVQNDNIAMHGHVVVNESVATYDPVTGVDEGNQKGIPDHFELSQNYPNPFNPVTVIRYQLPARVERSATSLYNVSLKIYDVLGQVVATLVDEVKLPGEYTISWDASAGTAGSKHALPSGVYFYRLQTPEFAQTKKLILMR